MFQDKKSGLSVAHILDDRTDYESVAHSIAHYLPYTLHDAHGFR